MSTLSGARTEAVAHNFAFDVMSRSCRVFFQVRLPCVLRVALPLAHALFVSFLCHYALLLFVLSSQLALDLSAYTHHEALGKL